MQGMEKKCMDHHERCHREKLKEVWKNCLAQTFLIISD